jgi:hypothetical protein
MRIPCPVAAQAPWNKGELRWAEAAVKREEIYAIQGTDKAIQ